MTFQNSEYFSELFCRVLTSYVSNMKNSRSAVETWNAVKILCDFTKKDFLDLKGTDISSFFDYMKDRVNRGTLKCTTVNSRKSIYNRLSMFINDNFPNIPFENNFVYIRPFASNMQIMPSKIPSLSDIDAILEASKSDYMYFVILSLAFRAALTASCIVNLKRRNVQTLDGKLALNFTGRNPLEGRVLYLSDDVADLLNRYLEIMDYEDQDGHLFYNRHRNPLTLRNLDKAVEKFVKMSGVTNRYTLKDLRSRAILDMIKATEDLDGDISCVANYAGIKQLRLNTYVGARRLVEECPSDLVNFRIVQYIDDVNMDKTLEEEVF